MNNPDNFGETRRVSVDAGGHPASGSPERKAPAQRPRSTPSRRAAQRKKQQRILIGVCIAAVVVLLIMIAVLVSMLTKPEQDDGRILNNVFAAGVDLSGMTKEEAKKELKAQTGSTYSVLDMTISILDNTYTLSPSKTGASLDVDAVVEAAYNYGRTGSKADREQAQKLSQTTAYTISVLPYLNLDTKYIQSFITDLGNQYATTLKQSSYSLEGIRPNMEQEIYDITIPYQTLTIQMGTAEYGLNTATLYEQVMDAYEINLFDVTAQCTVLAPDALDPEILYAYAGCLPFVNAELDPETYTVTPHVYGYGFTMEQLKTTLETAKYGQTITLELHFLEPEIMSDWYTKDMFQDTLATFSTPLSDDPAWNENLRLAAKRLNGTILKIGDTFSFNDVVGEPTEKDGFQYAGKYVGKSFQSVLGGGTCQAASTIYYCALMADLQIVERSSHSYAVSYIQAGFDAEIIPGLMDLKFTNTTENAIRIDVTVTDTELCVTILGSDTRAYSTMLSYGIDQIYVPGTVYNTMYEFNVGGYTDGTVLSEGITGYKISTYITRIDKLTGLPMVDEMTGLPLPDSLIATTYYAKRDQVVVDIYEPPVIDPTLPTDPTVPTDPSVPTDPVIPTDPVTPTDPTIPTVPTVPTEPTTPTVPTEPSEPAGTTPPEATQPQNP